MTDRNTPMVSVTSVTRTFGHGSAKVVALEDVSFDVARGRLVALVGRSGSGKTSLLNCIGGLDRPSSGRIEVDGVEIEKADWFPADAMPPFFPGRVSISQWVIHDFLRSRK